MKPAIPELLTGQTALITGASSGIGQAIAIAMAQAGARVVINFHSDEEGAEKTRQVVEKAGRKALVIQADVGSEEEVKKMVADAIDAFGSLDILVNNAGIQKDAPLSDMSLKEWQQVLDTNLTGAFLCAREAAIHFKKQGLREEHSLAAGKILFISSVHDIIPWAGRANYTAAKGGLMMLMKSLAQELARDRIRVNSISPGAIKTAINEQEWSQEEGKKKMLEQIPYGRIGDPEDIARAAIWLVSDQADYITGATLYVDGGMTLYPSFLGD
ncbi:glucose 1-dehydrogenase [Cesiribacter andamanensis]|uniref:Glucose 1-dehydrogenase 2 n=1 Tax=Cesiribacter andamanensis AMV16 TaxID=1279009 RepID=M7N7B1_9BACT|nr:glucose 1-dehydrogenase [Cesiribacter andamanensis]EMR04503.1 Glucose 1-dehydrogenase 2 [Cesiribacter andamanensis AMV16]